MAERSHTPHSLPSHLTPFATLFRNGRLNTEYCLSRVRFSWIASSLQSGNLARTPLHCHTGQPFVYSRAGKSVKVLAEQKHCRFDRNISDRNISCTTATMRILTPVILLTSLLTSSALELAELLRFSSALSTLTSATPGSIPSSGLPAPTQIPSTAILEKLE